MSRTGKGWAEYGISKWHKREIMNFCRRYDEWRRELQYGLRAISNDGTGGGSNRISRPTEAQAIRNDALRDNILLIERSVRDVCPDIYDDMLNNIARGVPFEYLQVPYTRTDFYTIRIRVYALIADRRERSAK